MPKSIRRRFATAQENRTHRGSGESFCTQTLDAVSMGRHDSGPCPGKAYEDDSGRPEKTPEYRGPHGILQASGNPGIFVERGSPNLRSHSQGCAAGRTMVRDLQEGRNRPGLLRAQERTADEIFPWDVTDHGVKKETLRKISRRLPR